MYRLLVALLLVTSVVSAPQCLDYCPRSTECLAVCEQTFCACSGRGATNAAISADGVNCLCDPGFTGKDCSTPYDAAEVDCAAGFQQPEAFQMTLPLPRFSVEAGTCTSCDSSPCRFGAAPHDLSLTTNYQGEPPQCCYGGIDVGPLYWVAPGIGTLYRDARFGLFVTAAAQLSPPVALRLRLVQPGGDRRIVTIHNSLYPHQTLGDGLEFVATSSPALWTILDLASSINTTGTLVASVSTGAYLNVTLGGQLAYSGLAQATHFRFATPRQTSMQYGVRFREDPHQNGPDGSITGPRSTALIDKVETDIECAAACFAHARTCVGSHRTGTLCQIWNSDAVSGTADSATTLSVHQALIPDGVFCPIILLGMSCNTTYGPYRIVSSDGSQGMAATTDQSTVQWSDRADIGAREWTLEVLDAGSTEMYVRLSGTALLLSVSEVGALELVAMDRYTTHTWYVRDACDDPSFHTQLAACDITTKGGVVLLCLSSSRDTCLRLVGTTLSAEAFDPEANADFAFYLQFGDVTTTAYDPISDEFTYEPVTFWRANTNEGACMSACKIGECYGYNYHSDPADPNYRQCNLVLEPIASKQAHAYTVSRWARYCGFTEVDVCDQWAHNGMIGCYATDAIFHPDGPTRDISTFHLQSEIHHDDTCMSPDIANVMLTSGGYVLNNSGLAGVFASPYVTTATLADYFVLVPDGAREHVYAIFSAFNGRYTLDADISSGGVYFHDERATRPHRWKLYAHDTIGGIANHVIIESDDVPGFCLYMNAGLVSISTNCSTVWTFVALDTDFQPVDVGGHVVNAFPSDPFLELNITGHVYPQGICRTACDLSPTCVESVAKPGIVCRLYDVTHTGVSGDPNDQGYNYVRGTLDCTLPLATPDTCEPSLIGPVQFSTGATIASRVEFYLEFVTLSEVRIIDATSGSFNDSISGANRDEVIFAYYPADAVVHGTRDDAFDWRRPIYYLASGYQDSGLNNFELLEIKLAVGLPRQYLAQTGSPLFIGLSATPTPLGVLPLGFASDINKAMIETSIDVQVPVVAGMSVVYRSTTVPHPMSCVALCATASPEQGCYIAETLATAGRIECRLFVAETSDNLATQTVYVRWTRLFSASVDSTFVAGIRLVSALAWDVNNDGGLTVQFNKQSKLDTRGGGTEIPVQYASVAPQMGRQGTPNWPGAFRLAMPHPLWHVPECSQTDPPALLRPQCIHVADENKCGVGCDLDNPESYDLFTGAGLCCAPELPTTRFGCFKRYEDPLKIYPYRSTVGSATSCFDCATSFVGPDVGPPDLFYVPKCCSYSACLSFTSNLGLTLDTSGDWRKESQASSSHLNGDRSGNTQDVLLPDPRLPCAPSRDYDDDALMYAHVIRPIYDSSGAFYIAAFMTVLDKWSEVVGQSQVPAKAQTAYTFTALDEVVYLCMDNFAGPMQLYYRNLGDNGGPYRCQWRSENFA